MQNAEMINETPDFVPPTEPSAELLGIIEKTVEVTVKKVLRKKNSKTKHNFVPCGGKTPGVDTVTLSPEEWKYFVEELETKDPFIAFNNAKYLAKLDRSFAQMEAGEGTVFTFDELEALVNG